MASHSVHHQITVGIVTDSVACIPSNIVSALGIEIVPVELVMEDRAYRDRVDITPDEFYHRIEGMKCLPTTSAISPGSYIEAYQGIGVYGAGSGQGRGEWQMSGRGQEECPPAPAPGKCGCHAGYTPLFGFRRPRS